MELTWERERKRERERVCPFSF